MAKPEAVEILCPTPSQDCGHHIWVLPGQHSICGKCGYIFVYSEEKTAEIGKELTDDREFETFVRGSKDLYIRHVLNAIPMGGAYDRRITWINGAGPACVHISQTNLSPSDFFKGFFGQDNEFLWANRYCSHSVEDPEVGFSNFYGIAEKSPLLKNRTEEVRVHLENFMRQKYGLDPANFIKFTGGVNGAMCWDSDSTFLWSCVLSEVFEVKTNQRIYFISETALPFLNLPPYQGSKKAGQYFDSKGHSL